MAARGWVYTPWIMLLSRIPMEDHEAVIEQGETSTSPMFGRAPGFPMSQALVQSVVELATLSAATRHLDQMTLTGLLRYRWILRRPCRMPVSSPPLVSGTQILSPLQHRLSRQLPAAWHLRTFCSFCVKCPQCSHGASHPWSPRNSLLNSWV